MEQKDTYKLLFPKEFIWIYERTRMIQKEIYEIRIRSGAPIALETAKGRFYAGNEKVLVRESGNAIVFCIQDVQNWLQHLCRHSLYAFREELVQGFFTVCGGHRIGVVGQIVWGESESENLKYISSINIRISHEVLDCSNELLSRIYRGKYLYSTLIVSPPMGGKTTLLRDLIRCISDGVYDNKPLKVGLIDERGEIAACYMGCAQNRIGINTDVYTNCHKAEGIFRLLRSMSPQVIAMDEIGDEYEIKAIRKAFYAGCTILATIHASGIETIQKNPGLSQLLGEGLFERIVILDRDFDVQIYDADGQLLNVKIE